MEQQGGGRANGEKEQFRSSVISRRKLLKTSGIAAAAGLAGCSSGDDSSGGTPASTQPATTERNTGKVTRTDGSTGTRIDRPGADTEMTTTETETRTENETEPGTTTPGDGEAVAETAELFNQMPEPNKLYEAGAVNEKYFETEQRAKDLYGESMFVYNVDKMIDDLDDGIVEQLAEGTSNDVIGRGFVGAEWTDVIDKTVFGDGAIGTITLDMDYEEIKQGLKDNYYLEKGEKDEKKNSRREPP